MIGDMAKKEPKYPDRHTSPKKVFYLPQELLDALRRYVASFSAQDKPEPTDSEVLRLALRQFLIREGFPPADAPGGT